MSTPLTLQDLKTNELAGDVQDAALSPASSYMSSLADEKELELSRKLSMDSWASADDKDDLLESQKGSVDTTATPPEYLVSLTKKLTFLGLYFFLNIALTLSNKHILVRIRTPWLLTVSHATATTIGCWAYVATGRLKLSTLSRREHCILVAFSSLFTLNIAVSNISLALVSVPFHQVVRSTTPVCTVLLYRAFFSRTYAKEVYWSFVPLIAGVALATIGEYSFTGLGFILTSLGVVLAAAKSIATNQLMTGTLALSPLELLARLSPLAGIQCLFYAYMSGEFSVVGDVVAADDCNATLLISIVVNATMAFMLNTVSFQANKMAGALTMSVCGNLKQVLTIVLAIVLFRVKITPINGVGMAIAACGAAYYSHVELARKAA